MKPLIALAGVLVCSWLLKQGLLETGSSYETLTLSLALLLIGGYGFGWLFRRFGLPKVSGYIVAGLFLGPYVLGLETHSQVKQLEFISHFALALISLAAGGELHLAALKKARGAIISLLVSRFVLVVGGVSGAIWLASPLFPFLSDLGGDRLLVAGLILGVLSFATSPSTLMAVLVETRAHGRFVSVVLGGTVVIDVLVVLLFAATLSFGAPLIDPLQSVNVLAVGLVVLEVALALGLGVLLALLLMGYLRLVGKELALVVLTVGFLVARLTPTFSELVSEFIGFEMHIEALLVCLSAGFVLRNFSTRGELLIDALNESALPVYVAFFSLTGAALDVATLRDFWVLALFVVVVRLFWLWASGVVAARVAGEPPAHGRWYGLSLSAQAGVSLGLAAMLKVRFPEMGNELGTLCIAIIVINQLVGPVLLKLGIVRTSG